MKTLLLLLLAVSSFSFGSVKQNSLQKPNFSHEISIKSTDGVDNFLNQWEEFRKTESCDVTYDQFQPIYESYLNLSAEDRAVIDTTSDSKEPEYTIKEIINYLIKRLYSPDTKNDGQKDTLEKSTTIIIVVTVAVFGMSTILVFFILKNKNIIH